VAVFDDRDDEGVGFILYGHDSVGNLARKAQGSPQGYFPKPDGYDGFCKLVYVGPGAE
jgi:hypothetical protein